MKISKYLAECDAPISQIGFMIALSGMANVMILAIINTATEMVSNNNLQARYFLLYLIVFVLYIYTQKYAFFQTVFAIEKFICRIRVRIADKIRSTQLHFIENSERGDMYTRLTQDSNVISQSGLLLITAVQAGMVLIFSLLYLAWLSPISFLMTIVFLILAVYIYLFYAKSISEQLYIATQKEAKFFGYFNHLFDGFKELKMNRQKSDDLFDQIDTLFKETEVLKVKVGLQQITHLMYSRLFFYLLLVILVFIVPSFHASHADEIYKISTTILFIIGPIGMVVSSLPSLSQSHVALENLGELEAQLDEVIIEIYFQQQPLVSDFKEIQLDKATFSYQDKQGKPLFSIGPIDLEIKKGEIVFIVGDNGSGKSTLLKLLTGLYYPNVGSPDMNHEPIDRSQYVSYRELFAIVFSDAHLFDKLYGLSNIDDKQVKVLLRLMQLEKKTKYREGKFTQLDLSTGQKKRLAFVAAVLENKPIYIFDELAANEDPQFRKSFYEVILPDLKQQGKTIIAVTHDDKYFHVADRILKMECGQLVDF
ncbi:MAG: cyclic peptide export ABC transporter [Gammaproteobacteria bacterium]|nr:MAG: cyclic peptide export ABC transporter [Gammaproteobacteria bacterium]